METNFYAGVFKNAGTGMNSQTADLRLLGWTVKVFDTERERDRFVIENGGRKLSERDVKVILGCGDWIADENGIVQNAADEPEQNRDDVILLYVDKFNDFAFEKNIDLKGKIPSFENISELDKLLGAEVRYCCDYAVRNSEYGKRVFKKYGDKVFNNRVDSVIKAALKELRKQYN